MTVMDPPDRLLARIKSGGSLPALSPVATALVEMASDETTSAKKLVTLIEQDPALTVRLIRLANSALFQAAVPVTTLQQAVVRKLAESMDPTSKSGKICAGGPGGSQATGGSAFGYDPGKTGGRASGPLVMAGCPLMDGTSISSSTFARVNAE